nr:BAG family molecular chaperone regulator 3-like [Ipomoea batatas]
MSIHAWISASTEPACLESGHFVTLRAKNEVNGEKRVEVSVIQMLLICGVKDKSKVVLVEDPISQEKRYLEMRKNAKMEKAVKCVSAWRLIGLVARRPGLGGVNLVTEAAEEVNVGALNNGVEPVEGDEALKVNEGTPSACRNHSMTEVVVDEIANNVRRDEGEIRDLRSERWAVPDVGRRREAKNWVFKYEMSSLPLLNQAPHRQLDRIRPEGLN